MYYYMQSQACNPADVIKANASICASGESNMPTVTTLYCTVKVGEFWCRVTA